MAYLILSTDGHEWNRQELTGPTVLGRAPDCDISIHDILLSRRHCRIVPSDNGWLLIDLASRNGTTVGNKSIEQCQLNQGDVIRAGKNSITFKADAFVALPNRSERPEFPPAINREESLASTVYGMPVALLKNESVSAARSMHRPTPKPRPLDPESFARDDLYGMLEQIASSSWDSIYAVNAQPLRRNRTLPQPIVAGIRLRPQRPLISIDLQASSKDRQFVPTRPTAKPRKRFSCINQWIARLGKLPMLHINLLGGRL